MLYRNLAAVPAWLGLSTLAFVVSTPALAQDRRLIEEVTVTA